MADNGYFGNDILEIKPIPEVFSTDLPPEFVHSNGGGGNNHLHVQVDLQPSQVTNIIIPSRNDFGSASVNSHFVKSNNIGNGGVGSVSTTGTGSVSSDPNQKFTYGKYFSEPSPYQGPEKFLEFYTNKPQLVVLDNQSGKTKEVRQKDGPSPTFIQFQPNAANEISVHASPIQFQQSTAVDDLEINGGHHRDEPISVSTSNRVSSVSSLDGKTQIKVSEQPDDKETDTRDILVQNHFNFHPNVRESAPPTSTTRPVNPPHVSGGNNFRQHLGPFAFNQGQPIQTPSFATNQVLIDNQSPFIDVQLSSQIGTNQGSSAFGQQLQPSNGANNNNNNNNEASQGNNSPPVLRNPSIQRPFKGEGFKQQQQHHHHPLNHPAQQSRPIVAPPAPPASHQQLPFEVQSQQFHKRPQSAPIQSSPADNHDRMTSQGPDMQISPQSQDDSFQHQKNSAPRPVPSTDHYNHQSYGQNPPPPPALPTPPSQAGPPPPPPFNPTFWNGPPPNTPPPYPFEKAPMPPTPPPVKRLPGSPIQGPSTLQSHVKQQQNVQSAVNDSINEIAGSHLSIMTPPPPPAVTTTTAGTPLAKPPRPEVRSPILGDHSNVHLRVQASPQSINNEFQLLINDGQYFAASTAMPQQQQQVDVHSFTPSGSGITTPDTVTVEVDSQTEYNGLTQMSKYHHIERKPAVHPPSLHHHTSMKISRVPHRPQPQKHHHHVRNSTYAAQYETVGNNGDGQILPPPPNNLKTNSRGTSKFYFNLNHKPYQFQNRERPITVVAPPSMTSTTMLPIDITTTTVATQVVQQPSTISTIRLRLPHKGVPFNKSPGAALSSGSTTTTTTIADDQMTMDLTPPPVRPIQLSYGHGFQKPSRFDGNEATKPPQTGESTYQTIKRPLRPSPEEIHEVSTSEPVQVTEKVQSYWDSHRDAPVRNRGPPPTTSPPLQEEGITASSSVAPLPRRTSIRDRAQVVFTTEGPYQFETAEPDIITVADGKDDSVYLKASWGPPYSFDQGPKIILTKTPEGDVPPEDILKSHVADNEMANTNTGRPSIDLVVIQAPRTNPKTTTVEPIEEKSRQGTSPETTSRRTSEIPTTTTAQATTEVFDDQSTTTEEVETEAPTTRSYIQAVRLRPKLSLSTTTTTHKPIIIRTNGTFVKPGDRPRIPFLRPSISVVSINSSTTTSTTTEGPLNKTESILVVMRPANQQPIIPHQHRPIGIITRKPDTKRPTSFLGPVTRDEDDAFHADSRLVIAGVHHIQDNGFPSDNKQFGGGKVSSNGESGNIFIHTDAETGHSADEDPSASASGSGSGSVEHSPDDYVVCEPGCNAAKNEKCVLFSDPGLGTLDGAVVKYTKCACRPGFARMFPDRPCKRE